MISFWKDSKNEKCSISVLIDLPTDVRPNLTLIPWASHCVHTTIPFRAILSYNIYCTYLSWYTNFSCWDEINYSIANECLNKVLYTFRDFVYVIAEVTFFRVWDTLSYIKKKYHFSNFFIFFWVDFYDFQSAPKKIKLKYL